MQQDSRIDHQTDGDEKDRAEHVANRFDQTLDLQQLTRLGHDRADQEGTQHHAVFQLDHQQAEAETQAQHGDQQHLVALESGDIGQQSRHHKDADHQRHNHEQRQLAHSGKHFSGADRAADRDTGQQRDNADAENVFHDQHAEDQLGKALVFHLQIVERLDDDGGGRDRQNRAEKQRIHGFPAKELPDLVTDPDHQGNFQKRRDERCGADLE